MKIQGLIIVACFFTASLLAQIRRPHDAIMKDVQFTFTSLKSNLDANRPDASIADAEKLQALFREVEDFWIPFKTKDALDFATSGQRTAADVAAKAKEGSIAKAQAAYGSIGKSCKGCHDSHRELMPDKTYRIKP